MAAWGLEKQGSLDLDSHCVFGEDGAGAESPQAAWAPAGPYVESGWRCRWTGSGRAGKSSELSKEAGELGSIPWTQVSNAVRSSLGYASKQGCTAATVGGPRWRPGLGGGWGVQEEANSGDLTLQIVRRCLWCTSLGAGSLWGPNAEGESCMEALVLAVEAPSTILPVLPGGMSDGGKKVQGGAWQGL